MKILSALILLLASSSVAAIEPLTVREVAKGIHVHFGRHELPDTHNHGAIANIGFIVGDKCVAVVDSGGNPEEGVALKKAVEKITDKPICYVINTHVHPDHIYGNIAFKAEGVKFVGHHKLARAMSTRGGYYVDRAKEQLGIELDAGNIIPPTLEVKGNMKIDLGNRILELTAHPTAHTDNDLSIYDKDTDTLWLSDLLFREHLPVLDGSLNGWIAELERLQKRDFRYVIPGHGALVTDWKNSLKPQLRYLGKLRDEIRVIIGQGGFLEDALKTVAYSEVKSWKLFDEFHRKNISTAFAELEWEE